MRSLRYVGISISSSEVHCSEERCTLGEEMKGGYQLIEMCGYFPHILIVVLHCWGLRRIGTTFRQVLHCVEVIDWL